MGSNGETTGFMLLASVQGTQLLLLGTNLAPTAACKHLGAMSEACKPVALSLHRVPTKDQLMQADTVHCRAGGPSHP